MQILLYTPSLCMSFLFAKDFGVPLKRMKTKVVIISVTPPNRLCFFFKMTHRPFLANRYVVALVSVSVVQMMYQPMTLLTILTNLLI